MLAALQALAALLARDPLTVDETVEQLGTVTHDYGVNVLLMPRDPLFKEANVVRGIDPATHRQSDTPAHVEVTPVEPPAVETLAEAFGTYRRVPGEEKTPNKVIFYLDMPGQPCTVALIAAVKKGRAVKITLRRDRRS
jgi:hypothetical protein